MFICICNAYRDSDITGLARSGVRCAHQAYSMLGSGPQCGQCLEQAQALIDLLHGAVPPADGTATQRSPGAGRMSPAHSGGLP